MKSVLTKTAFLALAFSLIIASTISVAIQKSEAATIETALVIDGAVSNKLSLSPTNLSAMTKTTVYGELYCEGMLIYKGNWTGVTIMSLLWKSGFNPDATNLEFHASDGYRINVSIAAARLSNYIIAYELNGQRLNEDFRLVLPEHPGNYWISSITRVEVTFSETYNIAPPDGIILPPPTPPSEATSSPMPTQPATTLPPIATVTPTIEPPPATVPTESPTETNNVTSTPQVSQSPIIQTPSPTSRASDSPFADIPETTSITASPLGEEQNKSTTSPKYSPEDSIAPALIGLVLAVAIIGCTALLLRRRQISELRKAI